MFNIVFFYLNYFHAFASAADEEDDELFASPSVCSLDNSSLWFNTEIQSGLNAKWYTFDQYLPDGSWNYDYRSPQYMSSGYSDFSCYHMERYLQNMDFDTPWPSNGEVEYGDYIYGYNTTYTNLTLELTGLYKAPLTGNYTFTFISSDTLLSCLLEMRHIIAMMSVIQLPEDYAGLSLTYQLASVMKQGILIASTLYLLSCQVLFRPVKTVRITLLMGLIAITDLEQLL